MTRSEFIEERVNIMVRKLNDEGEATDTKRLREIINHEICKLLLDLGGA
jgi:hypothetical protein